MKWMMLGVALLLAGFIFVAAGMLCMFYHAWKQASAGGAGETGTPEREGRPEVRGGGIVMIGPFPIIFGTDTASVKIVIILAIVLILLAFLLLLFGSRILTL